MTTKIVWLRGTQIGREFILTGSTVTIGRAPENTIAVGSGRASRRHAEVRVDAGGYLLVDLGSANGTIVNGARIDEPYRLIPGDLFEIGDELFRYEADAPSWSTTVTPGMKPRDMGDPPGSAARPARAARRSWQIPLALVTIAALAAAAIGAATSRGALPPVAAPARDARALDLLRSGAPPGGGPASPAAWTVLVYLAGDNDLESDALRDLNEMELVGSSDQLRIIVQLDRGGRLGAGERWAGTRRYYVTRDSDTERISSQVLEDRGQLSTGDPQNLADFIVWGVRQYPAERYALVLWDHGSAWAGIAFDTTSGGDGLSLPELQQALATAQNQLDGLRLDMIGFDACLMGQLDVLLAAAPYAQIGVASAELEPSDGWDWAALLGRVAQRPAVDGRELARAAVETYADYYTRRDDRIATLSAFDLSQMPDLLSRVDAFATQVQANLAATYRPLAEARSHAAIYSQPRPEEFNAVDLGDLARLTIASGAPAPVSQAADDLRRALESARVAHWSGPFHAQGSGLSIYFPQAADRYPASYEQLSPLPQQTGWGRMLARFYAPETPVVAPKVTALQVAPQQGGGALVDGTVSGSDIAAVYFFIGTPFADRSGVQLVQISDLRPDSAGSATWGAGPHALQQRWDAGQWAITNGEATIPVLLGPARPGSDLYGVEGLYQAQDGAPPIEAALLFRVTGDQATLLNVYGFPREEGRAAQPFEITPTPGDQFTAQIRTYAVDGARLIAGRVTGETIRFAQQPLQAVRAPVQPGSYVAGLLVRDITGQFSYQYLDLQVP